MKRSESYENPGKLAPGRGKSKYKGPGVGMSLKDRKTDTRDNAGGR